MADREYQRLTFSRSRTISGLVSVARSSLWLGRDHLLCIDTSGYTESYKRFYFRDIQAIVLRQTDRWIYTSLLAALFGLLLAWPALLWRSEPGVLWTFGILAGICGLAAMLNLAFGPTCIAQLRTAVQAELLPSLNRMRTARRVLTRLRPLIEQAQGQLSAEEIAARLREPAAASTTAPSDTGPAAPEAPYGVV